MRTFSRFLSLVFHPLLFTTYLVILLSIFLPRFLLIPSNAIWKFAGFVAVITFVFPVANMIMLKAFGTISSLEMESRRERIVPFLMITIFYAVVCGMFFYKVSVNLNFNKMMMIVTAMTAVATIVTFFFKISVHSLAMGGAIGIIMPLNKVADGELLYPVVAMIFLTGVVMSARLYLQAHTVREVGYGAAVGFMVGFFGMVLLF